MKALYPLLLLVSIFSGQLFAQAPAGDLYLYGGEGLQYVSFPAATVHDLDSIPATNITNSSEKLYSSFAYKPNPRLWAYGIASYDLATHQWIDSSMLHPAIDVDVWGNMLVVTTNEAPFLRVVNPSQQYQSRFELLDSTFQWAMETLVHDDRAYVLFQDKVAVVDLDLEDTLAVIRTDTIPRFWADAYNVSISEAEGNIYIYAEYATGAIRSTMMQIDPVTLTASQVVHVEFKGTRQPPLGANGKVFLYDYPGYFDPATDSMYFAPISQISDTYFPMAYDNASKTIFLYTNERLLGQPAINQVQNGQIAQPTMVNGRYEHAHWVPLSIINGIEKPNSFQFSVYPNPTPDYLEVSFPAPTQVYRYRLVDATGRSLIAGIPQSNRGFRLDLGNLPRGGYFLEIQSAEGVVSEQVVKW